MMSSSRGYVSKVRENILSHRDTVVEEEEEAVVADLTAAEEAEIATTTIIITITTTMLHLRLTKPQIGRETCGGRGVGAECIAKE